MTAPNSSYREIPLTRGQVAIVDATDFEWLNSWKWYALWSEHSKNFYAARTTCGSRKRKMVLMHREILGLKFGDTRKGDHIRVGATLDNRRFNLRVVNNHQSTCNRRTPVNNTSGTKGVCWHKRDNRWRARIKVNGVKISLGSFKLLEDARNAYIEGCIKYHGDYACLE